MHSVLLNKKKITSCISFHFSHRDISLIKAQQSTNINFNRVCILVVYRYQFDNIGHLQGQKPTLESFQNQD